MIAIHDTPIAGVKVLQSDAFLDERGAFGRIYCDRELESIVGRRSVVQINLSVTRRVGAVRGMHFQRAPHAEIKIVRCLRGRVLDVAVDLRRGSPTLMKWTACELSPQSQRALVIPEGCAHGFQVLEPDSELLYLHTAHYAKEAEGGVRFDDPRVAIAWPLAPVDLSARDRNHPLLPPDFDGIAA
ncbi:MAG TPA: dTDP-4-dehydrorhamnose 3,5-epimerase [Usitatibacter sp.]|jgi:dTDP-4-dehydrorhamnose 3,5-epimerase|nr:dTDP-4-dehydrorhamnose 3,5-epimerase [Usitatibacter sp.]